MKIRQKIIVKRAKDKQAADKRGQVMLYLNLKSYSEFKRICKSKGLVPSGVIDQMMEQFIEWK